MRPPLKLLFAVKAMNNPGGGAERVLADVANGLVERGHAVGLLTFEAPGEPPFYRLDPRIRRVDLGIGPTAGAATWGATLRRLPALRAAVVRERPDVVVAFMHSMFIPLGLALAGSGVPVVASEHTGPETYSRRPLQRLLLRLMPMLIDRITCVSEHARAKYPPPLRRKMVVVPNPVSLQPLPEAPRLDEAVSPKLVTAVGRLVPLKDHETLIRAFARIATDFPEWNLRIVGDGELRNELARLIAEAGLSARIELTGASNEVEKEYARASLFVVPSRYESFGLATAEALSQGLAVIGFADCPGTNELIRSDRNGVLVEAEGDRAESLAAAMAELMGDPERRRRLGAAGTLEARKFEIGAVLDAWESLLYDSLAQRA